MVEYKIMLFNTGGQGHAPDRQRAFADIFAQQQPSVVFTQECTKPFAEMIQANWIGNSEAGFIYRKDRFQKVTPSNISNIVEELKKNGQIETPADDFINRACVATFSCLDSFEFLGISWHGPHVGMNQSDKGAAWKDFRTVVGKLCDHDQFRGLPVLVGGDFNFKLKGWYNPKKEGYKLGNILVKLFAFDADATSRQDNIAGLVLYPYTPSGRRKKSVIDFFLSTPNLSLDNVARIDILDEYRTYFDHDPLKATLRTVAPAQKKLVYDSSRLAYGGVSHQYAHSSYGASYATPPPCPSINVMCQNADVIPEFEFI